MIRSAVLSDCLRYRYRLERDLERPGRRAVFLMVNPSIADAQVDDATIRKLIGFSERLDIGHFTVGNKFAFRATDINELKHARDPIGPANDSHLTDIIGAADLIVVAWGPVSKLPKGIARRRWQAISAMITAASKTPYSLGQPAGDGHPRHPLMLSYDSALTPWDWRYAASM